MDDVERVVSERIMSLVCPKSPLPPSLQASCVDPVLVNSLNDFVDAFHLNTGEPHACF
jgi:predicted component of type VI protein secretion system